MASTKIQPIPYLFFDGNCSTAMAFYAEVLGGEVFTLTYGEMPGENPVAEEHRHKVMNASLELPGGGILYGSDSCFGEPLPPASGFMIALNLDSAEEGQRIFDRLAEGGKIQMPYEPTFWAEKFGMVTDKFGTDWAINGKPKDRE